MDDEDVIAYLEAENDYFDTVIAPHQELIDTIYTEIEGRQPAELTSLPRKGRDWYYQWRYGEWSQYREWLRWPRRRSRGGRRVPPKTRRCSSVSRSWQRLE